MTVANFTGEDNLYGNYETSNAMDRIQNYKKPYVALIDGISMGGAAFYSMTAKYCVATEKTVFAMPETAIGFYTNAGSSYFLSRLKNNLGQYIALTGARITGYDVKKIGLASHYIESKNINDLINSLGDCQSDEDVSHAIDKFSKSGESKIEEFLPLIDQCFDSNSVEEIYENLYLNGSEFALKTIKTLNRMAPTSLKICHQQIKLGRNMSLRECLKMEQRMTVNIFLHLNKNFMEGIRAVIIDKDFKPKWEPSELKDVTSELVDKIFEKLPEKHELTFERNSSKL
jgi:3-hydroxyisobutyryl-CoA hydrolase